MPFVPLGFKKAIGLRIDCLNLVGIDFPYTFRPAARLVFTHHTKSTFIDSYRTPISDNAQARDATAIPPLVIADSEKAALNK